MMKKIRVTFYDIENTMEQFVESILSNDIAMINTHEEKLDVVINQYIRYYSSKWFDKNHKARSIDNSSALASKVQLYLLKENNLPRYMAELRNDPCNSKKVECLTFLKEEIFYKIKRIPIDELRKKINRTHFFVPNYDSYDAIDYSRLSPPEQLLEKERRSHVLEEWLNSSPEDREIVSLHSDLGLSFREMEEILGIKQSTLNKRFRRITSRMRDALRRKGVEF